MLAIHFHKKDAMQKKDAMRNQELRERIGLWMKNSEQRPLTPPATPQSAAIQAAMKASEPVILLSHVLEMEVTDGIKDTPAAKDLEDAVALARTGNTSNFPKVKELLKQVFEALKKVPYVPSPDDLVWGRPGKPVDPDTQVAAEGPQVDAANNPQAKPAGTPPADPDK